LAILEQKTLDWFGNTFPDQNKKYSSPFCLKLTKGKQSIREKSQLLKFETRRIIVKCLIKSSNQHKRKPKPQDITSPEFEPLRLLAPEAERP
jgi:hypothetical protein